LVNDGVFQMAKPNIRILLIIIAFLLIISSCVAKEQNPSIDRSTGTPAFPTSTISATNTAISTQTPTPTTSSTQQPTQTQNATEIAWQAHVSPTTKPGYPTPVSQNEYSSSHIIEQTYIGDFVINKWYYPNTISYNTTYYTIVSSSMPEEYIKTGIGGWYLQDVNKDGSDDIIFRIDTGMRCCYGALVYDVKNESKILDSYESFCHTEFIDLDMDGIDEFIACDRAHNFAFTCSEAGAPVTRVVYQYNSQTNEYEIASPKFSYLYNREIQNELSSIKKFNNYTVCSIGDVALNYYYSGREEQAQQFIQENTPADEKELLTQYIGETISSSRYIPSSEFRPTIERSFELPGNLMDDSIYSMQISPSGNIIAYRYKDFLAVFDPENQIIINQLPVQDDLMLDYAIHPKTNVIAYIDNERTIHLWNYITNSDKALALENSWPACVEFTPDGSQLAICVTEKILLFDLNRQKITAQFDIPTPAPFQNVDVLFTCEIDIQNSGKKIAATAGLYCTNFYIWDFDTHQVLGQNKGESHILFNPVDDSIFTSDNMHSSIDIYDAQTGEWLDTLTYSNGNFVIENNGKTIIVNNHNQLLFIDIQSKDTLYTIDRENYDIKQIALSPDGSLLYLLTIDNLIEVWKIY
jgi:hypothetical protein